MNAKVLLFVSFSIAACGSAPVATPDASVLDTAVRDEAMSADSVAIDASLDAVAAETDVQPDTATTVTAPAAARVLTVRNECPGLTVQVGSTGGFVRNCGADGSCPEGTACNRERMPPGCFWTLPAPETGSSELRSGEAAVYVLRNAALNHIVWSGHLHARTGCTTAGCETGICPGNRCGAGVGPVGPTTLAEFTLVDNGDDYYDISVMLPRNKYRGFRGSPGFMLTSRAPHNAEFLLRRPCNHVASTDSTTAHSAAVEHFGSIHIGVRACSTRDAYKLALRPTGLRIHHATRGAGLRGVRGIDFNHTTSRRFGFVAQKGHELPEPSIEQGAVESRLRCDVGAGVFDGSLCALGHVHQLQRFDKHRALVLGVVLGLTMQYRFSLPRDAAVDHSYTLCSTLSVLRSFRCTREFALCSRELGAGFEQRTRVLNGSSIAVSKQKNDTAINPDSGLVVGGRRISNSDLAGDGGKPLVAFSNESARLGCAFHVAMFDRSQRSQLGKLESSVSFATRQLEQLVMRFDQRSPVTTLGTLEPRLVPELAKEALPCTIQLHQELSTDVARNRCKPGERLAKWRQVVALVDRCGLQKARFELGDALTVGVVPQPPQRSFPRSEQFDLLECGIDSVAIAATNLHPSNVAFAAENTRYFFLEQCIQRETMVRPGGFSSSRHVVFKLVAHIVFVPKYRSKIITERVFAEQQAAWVEVCEALGVELMESNAEPDHVHLLLAYPPRVSLSTHVQRLKAHSSKRVRAKRFPEVFLVLRGPAFWSASYFVSSCGGAPLQVLRRYVEAKAGAAADPSQGPLPPRTPAAPTVRGLRGSALTGDVKR